MGFAISPAEPLLFMFDSLDDVQNTNGGANDNWLSQMKDPRSGRKKLRKKVQELKRINLRVQGQDNRETRKKSAKVDQRPRTKW